MVDSIRAINCMPVQKKKFYIAQKKIHLGLQLLAAGEKFWGFLHVEWPRSDLVIKANIRDSFEIDSSWIGVSDSDCLDA